MRCAVCGGRIYRPEVVRGRPAPYWLHTHDADWVDVPHEIVPRDDEQEH